jgi:hypothetical protein
MTEKEEKKSGRALIASRTAPLKARPRNQDPEDTNDK